MKLLIMCVIVALGTLPSVDAYNFRSKKAPTKQSQQNYQSQQPMDRAYKRASSNKMSANIYQQSNHRPIERNVQKQNGFGFEEFSNVPSNKQMPKVQRSVSSSRNMSRGPQRRAQTRSTQTRVMPKKKITKVAAMPQQVAPPRIQGYKGEYYGGGNALFQVDPGLIGRWSKPGLSAKNKFLK